MYKVEVILRYGRQVLDRWTKTIGLRTLQMAIKKDEWGESFAHCVNGVEFFAMGADYIPEDSILGNCSNQRTRRLLEDCVRAHFNVVRVWGGGIYPNDYFYECCDELGLVVWQDLMFACAIYNLTEEFENNTLEEIKDNIIRIRHHACLGLLCGNNEMELFIEMGKWNPTPRQKADYIKMYEYLFPRLLQKIAPDTFYWPASPSSGGNFDSPNDPNRGDVHFWDVWHGNKPFSEYQNHYFRYLSEFGFESLPNTQTINSFALPEEQNLFSYVMEKHQRKPGANGKILTYLSQTYLYPSTFGKLTYASQLLQAQAVCYGIEHLRRHRGRCMGAIYWQINDCWPVASWSSIDYSGSWKLLHYCVKQSFQPVLLSAQLNSSLLDNPDINQHYLANKARAKLVISNETHKNFDGQAVWEIRNAEGDIVLQGKQNICVEPFFAKEICQVNADAYDVFTHYLSYRLVDLKGDLVSERCELFCQPKYFQFRNPQLNLSVTEEGVVVTAKSFAKSVVVYTENGDILFEDNCFDMNPGTKKVDIIRGSAKDLSVTSVYDIR